MSIQITSFFLTALLQVGAAISVAAQAPTAEHALGRQADRPDIILIVSEDNGPELGCYGDKQARTPRLDALAASGTRFAQAHTTYSLCSPSRASLFTGLYPHQNGQVGLATHKYRMYDGILTMPVFMKQAGYRTGILGKIHVNPESSIPFDHRAVRSDNFGRKDMGEYLQRSEEFIKASAGPFLLMINFPDAHFPLVRQAEGMPAQPRSGKDMTGTLPFVGVSSDRLLGFTADYYNCMERMDQMCGQVFDMLKASGRDRNTVIIYLGDHGAQFSRGKQSNYEAGLRIPLIIYDPRAGKKNVVSNSFASIIDILPTLMDIAGVQKPAGLPGQSLMPATRREPLAIERRFVFSACDGGTSVFFHPTRGVRDKRYKLIRNLTPGVNPDFMLYASHYNTHFDGGTEETELAGASPRIRQAYATWRHPPAYELYDLIKDPFELQDLSGSPAHAKVLLDLQLALQQWQKDTRDPLGDSTLLKEYIDEIEAVRKRYPGDGYRKDSTFKWKFTDRFEAYVRKSE